MGGSATEPGLGEGYTANAAAMLYARWFETDPSIGSITIITPTTLPTWVTGSTPIGLEGTAGDGDGIDAVTWNNGLTGDSGSASGTHRT